MSLPEVLSGSGINVPEIPGASDIADKVAKAKASLIAKRNPLPQTHNPTPGATIQKTVAQIKQEAIDEAEYEYGLVVEEGMAPDDNDVFTHPNYAKIVDQSSSACVHAMSMFFDVLRGVIEALLKVYETINKLQKEVDDDLEDFPEFPDFPDMPEYPIPTIDTDELSCPLAECLGLPAIPSVKFPTGLPMEEALAPIFVPDPTNPGGPFIEQPSPYTESQWNEWNDARESYQDRLGQAIAVSAKTAGNNLVKLIKATPQGVLNGLVDGAKAVIGGMISSVVFSKIDSQLDCMTAKKPKLNKTYEILLYRKLKAQMAFDSANNPIIKLQGNAQEALNGVQDKLASINSKRNEMQGFLNKGSGATELPDSSPFNAVADLKDKFF